MLVLWVGTAPFPPNPSLRGDVLKTMFIMHIFFMNELLTPLY